MAICWWRYAGGDMPVPAWVQERLIRVPVIPQIPGILFSRQSNSIRRRRRHDSAAIVSNSSQRATSCSISVSSDAEPSVCVDDRASRREEMRYPESDA